jgi:hypothetical protein
MRFVFVIESAREATKSEEIKRMISEFQAAKERE